MTLKQFFELAGGTLIGLLFYASSLPALIKWPFIILFFLAGAALAFLPFEDRPLEVWVVAFLRSIYSPTLYYWAKTATKPKYFQDESVGSPPLNVIAPGGQAKLNKYLTQSAGENAPSATNLEENEKGFLTKVSGIFGQFIPGSAPTASQTQVEPQTATPQTNPVQEQSHTVYIPQTAPIGVPAQQQKQATQPLEPETPKMPQATSIAPAAPKVQTPAPEQAQFSQSASPPLPPSQPNTLTGQVLDASGRIIEGAILEIKDAAGRPVRAVKTNKLGHFYIVTPLSDGRYEILTEKEGYEFSALTFVAEGKIIPPIAIKANRGLAN